MVNPSPEAIECAVCNRREISLYKYEFCQQPSFFDFRLGLEVRNPLHACVYLCATDYNLAGKVRRELSEMLGSPPLPAEIIEAMIKYRSIHPIKVRTIEKE